MGGGGGIAKVVVEDMAKPVLESVEKVGAAVPKHFGDIGERLEKTAKNHTENEASITQKIRDIGGKDDGAGSVHGPHGGSDRPGGEGAGPHGGAGSGEPHGGVEPPPLKGNGEGGGSLEHDGAGKAHTEGDPVDVVSGQMISLVTDLDLPGLLPLVLRRAYTSGYRGGRLLGPGWSSTLDQRLEIDRDGIRYAGDDAQILRYPLPTRSDPAVLPDGGARWPLTWDRDQDTITIEDPRSGWTRHFTVLGAFRAGAAEVRPITALSDRNGHRIAFAFAADGVPTEVTHSAGYRVAVETAYTAAGFRVEALRLLDRAADGGAGGGAGGGTGGAEGGSAGGTTVIRFQYDPRGRLVAAVDSSGVPFVYEYDERDRITASIDRTGSRYEYEYDVAGRVARGAGEGGVLSATFEYDTERRVTTATNSLGEATEYHYDAHEHITRIVDARGNATVSEYDRYGRLVAATDPLGNTTRYVVDEWGDPVRIEQADGTAIEVEYGAPHQPVRVTGAGGTTWRYSYDERGNLLTVTDPLGGTARYTYDERGRLTSLTDPAGNTTLVRSDAAGLQIEYTDPLGATSRTERDAFGRAVAITDPLGNTTRFGWRPEGGPLWRVQPDGTREEWDHDAEGNVVEHRAPGGATTRYEYGPFGLRTREIRPDGGSYSLGYDTERNLTSVTNPEGLTWRYEYAPGGVLARQSDFNGRVTEFEHDAAGRLAARVNGAGQRVALTRDALGRVVERRPQDAPATTYEYDAEGRLLRAAGPDAVIEHGYDAAGRRIAQTVNGRTVTSRYDAAGRLVGRVTPSGVTSEWSYDAAGQPIGLTSGAGGSLAFAYDATGQETTRFLGPSAALTQTFDAAYRLASQSIWAYDAPAAEGGEYRALNQRTYDYRPDGYPVAITDTQRGDRRYELDAVGRVTTVSGPSWDERYAYDRSGNLSEATWPEAGDEAQGQRRYQGTLIGVAGRTTYEHDAQGRVVRTVRRTLSGQTRQWTYTWNADDQLVRATTPDGAVWEYGYDPFNRRISKTRLTGDGAVQQRTEFVWDGSRLAERISVGGDGRAQALTWDWEPGTDRVATQSHSHWVLDAPQEEIDRRFLAVVADRVGTPTELVDPGGHVVWRADGTVWGRRIAQSGPGAGFDGGEDAGPDAWAHCPLRFPGQYHDEETGLDYNHIRYYDADTARYLTPDPLGLFPAPNHYAYVPNPLSWCDPLGLAHHAQVTVYDANGQVRHSYGMVSGFTSDEEHALGWPNSSMATHTEARVGRMSGASATVPIPNDPYFNTRPVQAGDHVIIEGEQAPCPQCRGAMTRLKNELGVNVTYNWGPTMQHIWQA
ncbi:MAG TPA: DUF6531 domain-containing protein [Actinocrinis sp.]|nr:DUF6531 domain-containing protein [Actinocrinis sp.]